MTLITYREALRQALCEGMHEDSSIILLGEDVGSYGGAYGVSKGMLAEFGEKRVRDTPISEEAIVGAAVGAAMTGLRPVVEMMYIDFVTLAMDQLVNQAAKIRYMFGGQVGVPMVMRTQGGTGRSGAAQHSQSLEAWMMHTPGLHTALPATVTDAYCLLRHALTMPDPVVFIEHKRLYSLEGTLNPDEALPWGKAEIRKEGDDCTLVTYSRMTQLALEAAVLLDEYGISAEIIDLRTLHPLDMETVSESVVKTGRALVVSEDCLTAGVSAELSARIQEHAFDFLEEPVLRLAGEDIPVPVSPVLEQASVPSVERIVSTARLLMRK